MIGKKCEVEILGAAPRTINGKMGMRAINPEVIQNILDKRVCCCKSKCLQRWVDGLGEEAAIVLEGHRYAVAAMSEVARQHFFVGRIKDLLVPKTRVGAHGQGQITVGRCWLLALPSSGSVTGSWMVTLGVCGSLRAGYKPVKYRVNSSVDLCQVAYANIMGISTRTLQRYSQWAREGGGAVARGSGLGIDHRKTAAARCWLLHYAASHDIMPNASLRGKSMVGLPAGEPPPPFNTTALTDHGGPPCFVTGCVGGVGRPSKMRCVVLLLHVHAPGGLLQDRHTDL